MELTVMKLYAVCLNTADDNHPDDWWVEFYMAEDTDHAEEQATNANDGCAVVCVAVVPEPKTPDATVRSNGHLAFIRDTHGGFWEYYLYAGNIYRQTTVAPVMPDGRRAGRWYAKGNQATISHLMAETVNPSAPVRVVA